MAERFNPFDSLRDRYQPDDVRETARATSLGISLLTAAVDGRGGEAGHMADGMTREELRAALSITTSTAAVCLNVLKGFGLMDPDHFLSTLGVSAAREQT